MSQNYQNRSQRAIFFRGIGYFLAWMIMARGDLADVLPGVGAAALAAWMVV